MYEASGGSKRTDSKWVVPTVYSDEKGESHWGEKEFSMNPAKGKIGSMSDLINTKGVIFRATPADYDYDWHNAPAKQLIVNLNASVEVEVSDGTKRILQPGEVFLVEDVTGKGHKSRAVNGELRYSLFLPFPEELNQSKSS